MLRVTTALGFEETITNLQRRQQNLADAQDRMTSGLRVQRASDDPTAAARAERARSLMQRADSTQRAVDASKSAMTLTETSLADATELLQQARELVMAAGNASYSDAERADVANQLMAIRNQLLSIANRGDGAGGFVFAGQGGAYEPFIDQPGGVQYVGSGGSMQVASDETLPLTLDGGSVWLAARSGNGVFETRALADGGAWIDGGRVTAPASLTGSDYSVQFAVAADGTTTYTILQDGNATAATSVPYASGQSIEIDGMAFTITGQPADGETFEIVPSTPDLSVFDVLDSIATDLRTPLRGDSARSQTVNRGLRDISAVQGQLQSARSMTGETLNRLDGVQGRVDALQLFGESTRSAAEDLDMVQAIADFQNQEVGYSAALQSYATMQRMSLFDYLKV